MAGMLCPPVLVTSPRVRRSMYATVLLEVFGDIDISFKYLDGLLELNG